MANAVKYVEILTTHNRKNLNAWKFHGPVVMNFDENTKGYVLDCNGGSMQIPKSTPKSLKLIRPYVLFQIFLYPGKSLTLEFAVTDSQGSKRRIILTQCKTVVTHMMHSRLPNTFIEKSAWLHLYINVFSLFSLCFPNSTFRSIDGITLTAFCKLRRVYSLTETDIDYLLPSGFELPRYIQNRTQLVNSENFDQFLVTPKQSASLHKNPKSSSLSLPKIAIGKKVNIFLDREKFRSMRQSASEMQKEYLRGNLKEKEFFGKIDERENLKLGKKVDEGENSNLGSVRMKEKMRKITHIHYKEDHDGEIEENIEVEEKDEKGIGSRGGSDRFENFVTPDFYNSNLRGMRHRHVTPPFVNVGGNFVYNPCEKSYENSPNI